MIKYTYEAAETFEGCGDQQMFALLKRGPSLVFKTTAGVARTLEGCTDIVVSADKSPGFVMPMLEAVADYMNLRDKGDTKAWYFDLEPDTRKRYREFVMYKGEDLVCKFRLNEVELELARSIVDQLNMKAF
jgi:hypothetical protein